MTLDSSRQRRFTPPYDEKPYDVDYTFERYRAGRTRGLLLAFGDSLTNSGNVRSYESFPYHLFRTLSDAGAPRAVYNMGYCEDSTFGALAKLRAYLADEENPRPDAAIVLAGAADLFNLPLVQHQMLKDDSFWHDALPGGWLYRLRLYKVYRHLRLAWTLRAPEGDRTGSPEEDDAKLARLLAVFAEHKQTLGGDELRPLAPELVRRVRADFADDIERFHLEADSPGDFTDMLLSYASVVYARKTRYDEFFALLLEVARAFPRSFWTNHFDAANYYFVQAYQAQSKYTAGAVLAELDAAAAKHPEIARRDSFRSFRRLLTDREAVERFVDRRRYEAWDEIARLARERGFKLVLQNYPVEYPGANRVLEAVARKHDLPLVDNRALFARLIARDGRAPYIEDSDHLTPYGYEIMARNAARTLARAGLAPAPAAALDPVPARGDQERS